VVGECGFFVSNVKWKTSVSAKKN